MLSKDIIYENLVKIVSDKNVKRDELMSKHTSFRVGGIADFFVEINEMSKIVEVCKYVKENNIPLTCIGNGTNLLVLDKGIRGVTISIKMQNIEINETDKYVFIKAESGVSISKLANIAKEHGATGIEFCIGIPGTIGGAVKMNAGAYDSEMKDIVLETEYINDEGDIVVINNLEHEFSYRHSMFDNNNFIILNTTLKLNKGNVVEIEEKMNANMKNRMEKQPLDKPSAGSIFKRGNGFITAKLIEECGLKGTKIGGAEISMKHAGFIVNNGNATAKDILDLMKYIKDEIYKKYKVVIEPEVKVIGEE